jgi:hypothetical protein
MSTGNFAPTTGIVQRDGLTYCVAAPMPSLEADLLNQTGLNPAGFGVVNPGQGVALRYGQAVLASVFFNVLLKVSGTNYVILQGENGDGNWFDISGCVFSGSLAPGQTALFLLPCGPYGTVAVLQQTRAANTAPAANFANPIPPPGRFRFMGKGVAGGSGSGAAVTATVWFRTPPLR